MKISKMPDGSCEVYSSQQGEGRTIGELCVIVRLVGCSLACSFCDSAYTFYFEGDKRKNIYYKPVKREDYVMEMSIEEVEHEIRKQAGKVRRVVFTGGEPLLQQDDIIKVIELLERDGEKWVIEVETNGTLPIKEHIYFDYINCSPKLESSGNSVAQRHKPEVIKRFVELHQNKLLKTCFKFVITKDRYKEDLKEIRAWEKETGTPRDMIYLMPEGMERDEIIEGTKFLMSVCRKYGYKLSTRQQILIFGNKRAV